MYNLKYVTDGPVYEADRDSQAQRIGLWLGGRFRGGWSGRLGLEGVNCYMYRVGKQQGPTIQPWELYSVSFDKP